MNLNPALAVFVMAFSMASHSEPNDTISPEVLSAITHQALIVDVRTPEEFGDGHYPGAINIPHETILEGLNQLGVTADTSVILYCRSGNRSGQAEQALHEKGFTEARNAGGLEALLSATGRQAVIPPSGSPR